MKRILLAFLIYSLFNILIAQEAMLGDESDGSRAVPVHVIKMYDEHDGVIRPDDSPLLPFSTRTTCGKCHDYGIISNGWHFNAGNDSIPTGRRGQPWVYVDQETATQIPLSLRPWKGTYRPEDVGMSPLDFTTYFGRHLPGGGISEDEDAQLPENAMRWLVSGVLEVNCMSCHDGESAHDQAAFATQIKKQNFRWAAAASTGFARAEGSAKSMPDNYDIYFGIDPDNGKAIPPAIKYDESRFNEKNEVFFDIVRDVANERCYYCHSSKDVHPGGDRWELEEDVHIAAGMNCVDCHGNGLDHQMVRGFEGEAELTGNKTAAAFTCEGCHIPSDAASPIAGRLGAPIPEHKGLPPIHFEKMTCTACHSGSWPEDASLLVKTSRAHGLGTHGIDKSDEALPNIYTPIFARQQDGKIAPHKLLWPSFWAKMNANATQIEPYSPEDVRIIVRDVIAEIQSEIDSALAVQAHADSIAKAKADSILALQQAADSTQDSTIAETPAMEDTSIAEIAEVKDDRLLNWSKLSEDHIIRILKILAKQDSVMQPAFINGGKLYHLSGDRLVSSEHASAEAYTWAFGHDVRPAAQSLGVKGCGDCHTADAPIYFGDVTVSPAVNRQANTRSMAEFTNVNSVYSKIFAFTFYLRPLFKWFMIIASILLGGIILLFLSRQLSQFLDTIGKD